ncbi:MAG: DUF29 domain-containing protein [Nostoc sp. DedVER02]|uniref:DUF29 domain-containing protein n=1 Tax=unclassified Nostoc TaxID=2593658 RepID=UPI002AD527E0|nr:MULTISPECIES: DUF29 domain-containing protein [unclassified Nostoc]MDZ7988151.1 DUF29 domain-containing protein [Nostoc sp. DedVER02]MDZ8116187.1 DUF29 domain-containing protein [Nostoc sp. DedVER01b]
MTLEKIYVSQLYETDFYSWTQEQVSLLKTQQWNQLDTVNLIEEIETLGRRERQELRNRLGVLLGHLLKWYFQPEKRSNSWLSTIREQRIQIKLLLQDSPSLKPYLDEVFVSVYELGLALAIRETELGEQVFPEVCPYTLGETLNPEFLPNPNQLNEQSE